MGVVRSGGELLGGVGYLRVMLGSTTRGRILVIEDDDVLRGIVVDWLWRAGYAVVGAADGRHGLWAFRADPADLVITDMVMPNREGILPMIRLHEESPGTPIVAIAGLRSPQDLDVTLKLGASRTLAQPFTREALLGAVYEGMGRVAA